jgi:SAM-dependent methyltransferase
MERVKEMERKPEMEGEGEGVRVRGCFQGITNIVRFNWHFYLLAAVAILGILGFNDFSGGAYSYYIFIPVLLMTVVISVSLVVSFFVYDLSGLYLLDWLDELGMRSIGGKIVNINAGFDETSVLLHSKYPGREFEVFDFYDPGKNTEISIKRARKAYPPYKGTVAIDASALPLQDGGAGMIFVIFSAHEIRNEQERICFFKELNRLLEPGGRIIVTEHLRDLSNFLAYNIGFFHFFSRSSWLKSFAGADLAICREMKINPFITTFMLKKNGASS